MDPSARVCLGVIVGAKGLRGIFGKYFPAVSKIPQKGFYCNNANAAMLKSVWVGRLVSNDQTAAMVVATLMENDPETGERLDLQAVAAQLEGIRAKYENENTTVHIIGFAKMVGDISDGAMSVIKFFLITIAFTWLLLYLYSSSMKLASLTVLSALVSVVWMLGALKLMGFGIDPMNMLTPFLIFAIAVSHGEQMINRFRGEIFFGGLEEGTVEELRARAKDAVEPLEAARLSFRMLLVPGTVALLAGCIGFGAIMVIPIDMVRELAITATVGVALTILTDLVLLPVLLSYTRLRNLDRKREFRLRQLTRFDKIWAALSRLSKPGPAAALILVGLVVWFFAWQHGNKVMIGDAQKGVAELRPDARYNQDAVLIAERFALGVDIMNVIAEAAPSACTTSFAAMETIDRFAWHMENVEGVEQVITLPAAAKIVNAGWNDGSVRWRVLPRDPDTLRQATQSFETDSGLLNADCSAIPITIFTSDHQATTIDRVVAAVAPGDAEGTTLVPDMATDLGTVTNGGKTWQFTLRDGMKWENGNPVTCEDVAYGVSRQFDVGLTQGGGRWLQGLGRDPGRVQVASNVLHLTRQPDHLGVEQLVDLGACAHRGHPRGQQPEQRPASGDDGASRRHEARRLEQGLRRPLQIGQRLGAGH